MKKLNRAAFIKGGAALMASIGLVNSIGRTQTGSGPSSGDIEKKLKEMGLSLPQAPKPVGAYVAARRSGSLLYISMQFPYVDGKLLQPDGKVGREVSIEQGQAARAVMGVQSLPLGAPVALDVILEI